MEVVRPEVPDTSDITVAVLVMAKNEEDVIAKTIKSCEGADEFYLYDTGSTDNTISEARQACKDIHLSCQVLEGEFTDFATSRNELLEWVRRVSTSKYYLLLDANDELNCSMSELKLTIFKNPTIETFIVRCIFHHKDGEHLYLSPRLISAKSRGQYKGKIHEYYTITPPTGKTPKRICIIQDRTLEKQNEKTLERMKNRDIPLLEEEFENTGDFRWIYYIVRTKYALEASIEELREDIDRAIAAVDNKTPKDQIWYLFNLLARKYFYSKDYKMAKFYCLRATQFLLRAETLILLIHIYFEEDPMICMVLCVMLSCLGEPQGDFVASVNQKVYDYYRWKLIYEICSKIPTDQFDELERNAYNRLRMFEIETHENDNNEISVPENFSLE